MADSPLVLDRAAVHTLSACAYVLSQVNTGTGLCRWSVSARSGNHSSESGVQATLHSLCALEVIR